MDDLGERARHGRSFQRPRWKHRGTVALRNVFDGGVEHDSRGRLCSTFRNSQFGIRHSQFSWLFSGIHFVLDDWGERARHGRSFQRPRWKHRGTVALRNVFDGGVEHDSRGRLCSPFPITGRGAHARGWAMTEI
jgi:hypothetical protein